MNTSSFIELARLGKNKAGLYAAVSGLVLVAWILGSIAGAWALVRWKEDPDYLPIYVVTGLMIAGFVPPLLTLLFGVGRIHLRHWHTLISPTGIDWIRILKSAGLWFACSAFVEFCTFLLFPDKYILTLNLGDFLPCLLLGLCLIPLQTSLEELWFRGHLLQGIGSWNIWGGVIITSVIFGLLHGANEELETIGPIALVYYVGVGVAFALITLKDNTLELPLGMHAANNIYAFLFVGYPSSSVPSATIWAINELNFPLMMTQWILALGLFWGLSKWFLKKANA